MSRTSLMNYASLDDVEPGSDYSLLTFHDKLNKLKYFNFNGATTDCGKVECNIFELIPEYRKAVDKLFEVQSKVEKVEKEIATLTDLIRQLSRDTSYTEKLQEIIDQFTQDAKLDELKAAYTEAASNVQKYQGAFDLCKDADIHNKYMCFVCLERSVNIYNDPCGHTLCDECSSKTGTRCPMCRAVVGRKGRFYLSV